MSDEEDKAAAEAKAKTDADQKKLDDEQKAAAEKVKEEGKKSTLAEAKETVAALKVENERHEANMKKQEEMNAEALLNGQTPASPQQAKQEETPAEYAKKVMAGEIEQNE